MPNKRSRDTLISIILLQNFSLMNKQQSIDFPKYEARLPPSILNLLRYEGAFWNAKVIYEKQFGNENSVLQTYLEAMHYLPRDPDVFADFYIS